MRRLLGAGILGLALGLTPGTATAARCGADPGDAAAVAAARAQVEAECDCAGAANHGAYVRCASAIAKERADAGTLPKQCKGEVTRCAAKSTCGKPGFVTCCITRIKKGVPSTKCSIKSDASKCVAPKNGSACVGVFPSCCDACTDEGCAGATTTTTTAAPTTTTTLASPSGAFLSD